LQNRRNSKSYFSRIGGTANVIVAGQEGQPTLTKAEQEEHPTVTVAGQDLGELNSYWTTAEQEGQPTVARAVQEKQTVSSAAAGTTTVDSSQ
jgi:hypothetical protein